MIPLRSTPVHAVRNPVMSIKDAMAFIRLAHEDSDLADKIDALGTGATLQQVVALASEKGFAVTEDDLRSAHKHDWGLRWTALSSRAAVDPKP